MKKAGSPTGLEVLSGRRGFTLLETLFAILILSSGIIFIAPALFKSGTILAHISCGYQASILADNLIAEKEEDLWSHHQIDELTSRGQVSSQGVDYSYEIETSRQDVIGRFYRLTVRIFWKDIHENRIERTAYILQ